MHGCGASDVWRMAKEVELPGECGSQLGEKSFDQCRTKSMRTRRAMERERRSGSDVTSQAVLIPRLSVGRGRLGVDGVVDVGMMRVDRLSVVTTVRRYIVTTVRRCIVTTVRRCIVTGTRRRVVDRDRRCVVTGVGRPEA